MRNLFILRGAPASGKSTWIKENNLEQYTLSADQIRLMYQSPCTNLDGTRYISQNNDTQVWKLLFEFLERRMERGEFVIIDATHYKSSLISRYKELVDKYRYRVNVIDFSKVPEEELLKRNAERDEFKKVPEEVIQKMVVALKDDNEVKKAYKILTPEEAITMLRTPLQPVNLDQMGYEKVVVFGDIHGCYEPLKTYFEKNPFNEKTCYIFCGDYIDRGLQNKEVLKFLLSIYKNKNVILLEGNHEKWLRMYADKEYNETDYKKVDKYKDLCFKKVLSQLEHRKQLITKYMHKNKQESEELWKLYKEAIEQNPESETVFYQFEEVNVEERQKVLKEEYKKLDDKLAGLNLFIIQLTYEQNSTLNLLVDVQTWFKYNFNETLSFDIMNLLEKEYPVTPKKLENPIKSSEFLNNTVPQIWDIDKAELRQLCRKFCQLSYFTFKANKYLVTHAGVPCMPDIFTPTEEIIKGVGKYEDHEKVDKMFVEKHPGITTIHGHRNVLKNKIYNEVEDIDSCYKYFINLCSEIEYGEPLRIIEITQHICMPFNLIDEIEIPNPVHSEKPQPKKETKSQLEILKEISSNKYIQVKKLKDNIQSFNFTRNAFEHGHWNDFTCTARGLFVDKTNGNIVARAYSKFF